MTSYWQLLQLVAPVFAIIGIGIGMRRAQWLTAETDQSLLKLFICFFYPCLILDSILGNASLRTPANLLIPPLLGFITIAVGMLVALWAGRRAGLAPGAAQRTFAFSTGIYNYGYIPIPVMAMLFGPASLGVLLVFNVGCDIAVWTLGLFLLANQPLQESSRRLLNPPILSLVAGVLLDLLGLGSHLPFFVLSTLHLCGQCAIPVGLLLIGATIENLVLGETASLFDLKVMGLSSFLRMGLFPLGFLALVRYLPLPLDLRRVLVVQAAMPAGIFAVVIAKHYGGRVLVAAQVSVASSVLGFFLIPLWLQFGLSLLAVT